VVIDSSRIYVALMHHPVKNKAGDVVTTAITNLDLHDIARLARTYDLGGYYVVNPMPAQRELAGRIVSHWVEGFGSEYNPNRCDALRKISVVGTLDEAKAEIAAMHGSAPRVVATAARQADGAVGYPAMRREMEAGGPLILAFGTGWGLTDDFINGCDMALMPVSGRGGYNHLPVRAAVAIILDRLLGERA
jgi:hypothetical protein